MSDISHSDELVTKQELASFYQGILPYLGGMPTAIADKFDRSDIYSTDEKIIGCWTDGRPLYQKTFTATAPNCTTDGTDVSSSISIGATVSTVVDVRGMVKFTTDYSSELTFIGSALPTNTTKIPRLMLQVSDNSPSSSSNKNKIRITNNVSGYNGLPLTITVQYTKTTDAANSFNASSESDYSTAEKVIGTWIDGKPLYQKVITGTLSTGASSSTIKDDYYSIGASVNIGFVDKFCLLSSTGACINLNQTDYASTGVNVNIVNNSASSNANKFHVKNNISSWGGRTFYAVIQYTKTTD